MPYSTTYTQTTTHQISNSINSFSRSIPLQFTASGNERRIINETIPSGMPAATLSGINLTFLTGSGTFLAFSANTANYPLTISGQGWGYKIDLSTGNNNNCVFFKTGVGFFNIDNLAIKDISGTLWVNNTGNSARTLTVETLSDVTSNWGTPIFP